MQVGFPSQATGWRKRPVLFPEFVWRARDLSRCRRDGNSRLVGFEEEPLMKRLCLLAWRLRAAARGLGIALVSLALAVPVLAQAGNSPWENAVNVLQQAFTSTIARGLSLVAIVVSGLTFAFGEGGSKRVLAGVLFGVGMAIAAVNFLAWLFPA